MVALLFPGQGSQSIGMGKALYEAHAIARQTFEEANDALGDDLAALCFDGPEDALKRTENTQPALLTTSVATARVLDHLQPGLRISMLAGHSLGEWSALVAAGALPFADAVRAVRERGRLMQKAVPEGHGAMIAVLGLDADTIRDACAAAQRDGHLVEPANFNSPEQTVVSGTTSGVEALKPTLEGAKKIVDLPVSAPFHCSLMRPAADGLAAVLAEIDVSALRAPIVSNVDATPNDDPSRVKGLLVAQVTAAVRWVECMQAIVASGETVALELGPGGVLRGLARRIDRSLTVHAVSDPESFDKALSAIA